MNSIIAQPHTDSARGEQLAALLAAAHLAEHAPTLVSRWDISASGIKVQLSGGTTLDDIRAQVVEWAGLLGLEPDAITARAYQNGDRKLSVTAVYRGVPVEVWNATVKGVTR